MAATRRGYQQPARDGMVDVRPAVDQSLTPCGTAGGDAGDHPGENPGDDPDELFDLVDLDDRVIGRVRRGEAHRDASLVHRSVQVLVFTRDDRILLQRRSRSKDLFPGYFCASACGHVASGEDYETTAHREIAEELGVSPRLAYAGKVLVRSGPETEMTALFLARCDGPFHFHPAETDGGVLVSRMEARQGRAHGSLAMTPALQAALDALDCLERAGTLDSLLRRL